LAGDFFQETLLRVDIKKKKKKHLWRLEKFLRLNEKDKLNCRREERDFLNKELQFET